MKETKPGFLHTAVLAGLLLVGYSAIARCAAVTLEWDPVTTNEDGTPISDLSGYRLFRSASSLLGLTTAQAMANTSITKTDVSGTATSLEVTIPADQTLYFRLTALDTSGNQSGFNVDSNNLDVQVSTLIATSLPPADTTAPIVSITAPANGATISGSAVSVAATASDNVGVAGVQFIVDGNNMGTEDISSPYAYSLNTLSLSNGSHVLTARARDAAGNTTTSAGATVTVNNDVTAPSISGVSIANLTMSGVQINWTTNEASNSQVEYGLTTAYGSSSALDIAEVTSHSRSLSGLSSNTTYHYRVKSRDAAGNLATSGDFTFTTANDTIAPVATINSPTGGSTRKKVSVNISATDNIAVQRVDLLADGVQVASQLLSPAVPSATVSLSYVFQKLGQHTLQARAVDTAGNQDLSSLVTILVKSGNVSAFRFSSQGSFAVSAGSAGDGEEDDAPRALVVSYQPGARQQLAFDPMVKEVNVLTLRGRRIFSATRTGTSGIVIDLQNPSDGQIGLESGLTGIVCMRQEEIAGSNEPVDPGVQCVPLVVVK